MIATGIAIWTRFGNAYSNESYPWSQARQGPKGPHKICCPYGNFHVIKCRRKRSPLKSFHSRPLRGLRKASKQETPKRREGGRRQRARRGGQHQNGKHMPPQPRELQSSCPKQNLGGPRQKGAEEPLGMAGRMRNPPGSRAPREGRGGGQRPSEPPPQLMGKMHRNKTQ